MTPCPSIKSPQTRATPHAHLETDGLRQKPSYHHQSHLQLLCNELLFKNEQTILQDRNSKKILNIHALKTSAEKLGFRDVCVLKFETLSLENQVRLVSKARMLLGVQGAGLQWSIFMPNNSLLIEVAWPHKLWPFYYAAFVKPYGIRYSNLAVQDVFVNWTSYENAVLKGKKMKKSENKKG